MSKLAKNTFIYAVGNFGSKLLSFILLPIYTVYLAPDDFGQIDLYILASSLIIPIFTLQSIDAAYRKMLDASSSDDLKICVTNILCIYSAGGLIFSLLFVLFCSVFEVAYAVLFYFYILSTATFQMLQQITRGLKQNAAFSASGVLLSLVQGMTNIALILVFGWGASSLLLAPIVASVVGIALLMTLTRLYRYIDVEAVSFGVIRKMISFSAPLCVHSLCWWSISSLGTFILTFSTGNTELSGIYAMGNKFSQVLTMINSIFFLAWQESAVEEYKSKDASSFYGRAYIGLFRIEIGMVLVFMPIVKLYFWAVGDGSYAQVLEYIPAILSVNILSASISFFSSIFNVVKQTKTVFYSSVVSLVITFIVFVLTIPRFEIWGIVAGMAVGYLTMLVWRVVQASRYIKIQCSANDVLPAIAVLFLFTCAYYFSTITYQLFLLVLSLCCALLLNRQLVIRFLEMIRFKLLRRQK